MKLLTLLVAAALLAGCGSSTGTPTPVAPSAIAPSSTTPTSSVPSTSAGASPTPFAGAPTTVRLALDWTPNTDHTGFFVARHEASSSSSMRCIRCSSA